MSLIGRGATGTVYQLNASIAVKRARLGEDEESDHANELQASRKLLADTSSDSMVLSNTEEYVFRACTQWECRNVGQQVPAAQHTRLPSP